MKRRTFVRLSVVGAAAISIPLLNCNQRKPVLNKALVQPLLLSHICDAKTMAEIGTTYRQQVPAETKEEKLVTLLLIDTTGKSVSQLSDTSFIQLLLDQKIQQDFDRGNTVIVKGWVLSATEARQCALFSLTQQ